MAENKVAFRIDMQCGACGALCHLEAPKEGAVQAPTPGIRAPKFCAACGAGFERYCISCRKRVDMFFEEWWPEEEECVRTYTPAKHCPHCNAGLEVDSRSAAAQ